MTVAAVDARRKFGPTPAQHITFTGSDGSSVRVLRGLTAPSITNGFGGWNQVARPRRMALTQWGGGNPIEVTFSVLFDGIHDGSGSVEAGIAALERLALSPSPNIAPPTVKIDGGIPHPDATWIIEALQWDPSPDYDQKGDRIRQECTVLLLQYVSAKDGLKAQQRAVQAAAPTNGTASTYTVRPGDTLLSVAASQLGDASQWAALADLNEIRDPRFLAAGTVLRLP